MPESWGLKLAEPLFEKATIIGCGLIGSSLLRVARRNNLARTLIAADSSPTVVSRVAELGLADETTTDLAAAVSDAGLVILCVPVGANEVVAKTIGAALSQGAIVSDVGSVKGAVVGAVSPHIPSGVHLIPAHPVAGTEHSGPDAGFATLFLNRWCILTPPANADASAVKKLSDFWTAAGSNVEVMSPEHHDLVLAITSHVPHLIAYNIVAIPVAALGFLTPTFSALAMGLSDVVLAINSVRLFVKKVA